MTAIALSLQVPDAELGNAPLPHMLGLDDDGGEGGGRKSQGQGRALAPQAGLQHALRSPWLRHLPPSLPFLSVPCRGRQRISRRPEGRPLGFCDFVLLPLTSPAPPFLLSFSVSIFIPPFLFTATYDIVKFIIHRHGYIFKESRSFLRLFQARTTFLPVASGQGSVAAGWASSKRSSRQCEQTGRSA